jgi:AhpD family alkylhydroperoxidase
MNPDIPRIQRKVKPVDQDDKERIEKIIQDRRAAHQALIGRKSNVYDAFLQLEKAAFSDGRLPKVQKELIAVGISVVIDCESCMEWHIHQALLSGATEAQVLEAIEVGIEMGGGPATVSARFALKVLEYHESSKTGAP